MAEPILFLEGEVTPSQEVVQRAQDKMAEIRPYYWEYGGRVRNFYRGLEKKMAETGTSLCLAAGDVRCGKTVEAVKWQAEEPGRVSYVSTEGQGNANSEEVVSYILTGLEGKKPEVLIIDEIGYVNDFPRVFQALEGVLPETKFIAVFPVRLDESLDWIQELGEYVEDGGGLKAEFPATWTEEETKRYFNKRCELENVSLSPTVQEQVGDAIDYLSLGIPKGIEQITGELFTFLQSKPDLSPGDLNEAITYGLGYYINPDSSTVFPPLAIEAGNCFARASHNLNELVLKQMPPERLEERRGQQERIGVYYMLRNRLEAEGILVGKPSYEAIPIFPVKPEAGEHSIINDEKVARYLQQLCVRNKQSAFLVGFSPKEQERVVERLRSGINQPVLRLDLIGILERSPDEQNKVIQRELARQLNVPEPDSASRFREVARGARIGLIVLSGIDKCLEKGLAMPSATSGYLRGLTFNIPMIALGDLPKIPIPDSLGSPLWNVFDRVGTDYFREK